MHKNFFVDNHLEIQEYGMTTLHCSLVGILPLKMFGPLADILNKWPYLEGSKGQLNSEWIYEVIVSPKMQT